jgi:N utilization substance protein B
MKKQTRTQARTEVFKLIFQAETNSDDMEFLIQHMLDEHPESIDNIGYIRECVFGVIEKKEELEEDISENLTSGWRLERIPKVALCVMKLAVFEIKYVDDVPEKVAVNEAVELEKKYDDPDHSAFVNGVLGGFLKKRVQ